MTTPACLRGCDCPACEAERVRDELVRLRGENALLRARLEQSQLEVARLRGGDYVVIPRTMLLELGDKLAAMEQAIGLPTDIE